MKAAKIRELTNEELARQLDECRREGFNLRMQQQTGQLENTGRIREVRREVARLETEKTARARR
ncbi:MAG: 50S ribosomal protein L29 [Lentisphaerae bacterium]|nr:50S ribosomal protein L29 [Lentisphaerota bacterium]